MVRPDDQVRPRIADLADVDDTSPDALMDWPPAATAIRRHAPTVGAAASASSREQPDAPETATSADAEPRGRRVRFDLERGAGNGAGTGACDEAPGRGGEPALEPDTGAPENDPENAQLPPRPPIMGEIREHLHSQPVSMRHGEQRPSRFRAMREAEKGATEEPVSAFRRARMQKEGGKKAGSHSFPPATIHSHAVPPPQTDAVPESPCPAATPAAATDPTRDPGGGAPPDQMTSLLDSIARENEGRLSSMNYASVDEELHDAAAFFGADTLEKLAGRRDVSRGGRPEEPSAGPPRGWPIVERLPAEPPSQNTASPVAQERDTAADQESFRARYFPEEPDAVPPSLEWTVPHTDERSTHDVRFNFQGAPIWRPAVGTSATGDATFLAGLHHHGNDQHAPGYTVDELLHLGRSSVAAQRTMAFQVLARICDTHPQHLNGACGFARGAFFASAPEDLRTALDADAGTPRMQIMLLARWCLVDRHQSVRAAALACLRAALASVSALPADVSAVWRAGVLPDAVDPPQDWLWLAALRREDAWSPRARPPLFHTQDASYSELLRRNWAAALRQTDVLPVLDALAAGDDGSRAYGEVRAHIADVVYFLALHDVRTAQDVPPHVMRCVAGAAGPWPLVAGQVWPPAHTLLVLLRAVQSGREVAARLVEMGVTDAVLRYVLLLPQDCGGAPVGDEIAVHEHALLFATLRVFTALARYGLASTSVREVWAPLQRLGTWAAHVLEDAGSGASPTRHTARLHTACAVFEMMDICTLQAMRGPQLGDLGVNWPMVAPWVGYSAAACGAFSALRAAAAPMATAAAGALSFQVAAAAAGHMASWRAAASTVEPDALVDAPVCPPFLEAALLSLHAALADADACRIRGDVDACRAAAHSVYVFAAAAGVLQRWDGLADAARARVADAQNAILASSLIDALAAPVFSVVGGDALRAVLLVEAGACTPTDAWHRFLVLQALSVNEADDVAALLESTVSQIDAGVWRVLAPFLRENVLGGVARAEGGVHTSLLQALVRSAAAPTPRAFFVTAPPAAEPATDPVTDAVLWQSPSAGLPLRRDWPFLALDDLLHSGDAQSLNRKDALPPDWDFSETDIVLASLQLAHAVADLVLARETPTLTSAAMWLGIAKVYLLEEHPGATAYSGAATGRDLYAQPAVAGQIDALQRSADRAALCRNAPPDTLEDAFEYSGTAGASFYQMYTDLVGLYDAVSFGHASFAKMLLPPLAMVYAADYRRLLWCDYAQVLRSITLAVHDAPVVAPPPAGTGEQRRMFSYLWPTERDPNVLSAYASALASAQVTHEHQPLLATIAEHHVSAALWAPLEPEQWDISGHGGGMNRPPVPPILRERIARVIYAPATRREVSLRVLHRAPLGEAQPAAIDARQRAIDAITGT
ncbi:hypothetical protein MSPP1_000708 [Malassezia sp. CBS 17886]|nr:hypothetical protein MSPP1_000708 [Malassezia sp. CBS 17886]